MASVIVSNKSLTSSKIKSKKYPVAKLNNIGNIATVIELRNLLSSAQEKEYAIIDILSDQRSSSINEVLPFRVRFTTIGIPSAYSNVPGIGLQVIGVNNYIL